jgi:hypothetical protein
MVAVAAALQRQRYGSGFVWWWWRWHQLGGSAAGAAAAAAVAVVAAHQRGGNGGLEHAAKARWNNLVPSTVPSQLGKLRNLPHTWILMKTQVR